MNECLTCRLCLKKATLKSCKKISVEPACANNRKSIAEMITECLPEMIIDVVLEPVICNDCYSKLNASCKFKQMCLKNDKIYHQKLVTNRSHEKNTTKNSTVNESANLDLNQNESSLSDVPNQIETTPVTPENKKKFFGFYKIRFTNSNCFGCKNRILNVRYHQHKREDDEPDKLKYVCFNCNKTFAYYGVLKKHVYLHRLVRKCNICGKKCRDKYALNQHLTSHTGEKAFQCPECDKKFAQSYSLHQHLALHINRNGQNKCEICGKILSTKYNLKIHRMSHTKDKPITCNKCNKWFYTKAALEKHTPKCEVTKKQVKDEVYTEEITFIKTENTYDHIKEETRSDDDVFVEFPLPINVKQEDKKLFLYNNFIKKEEAL